MHAEMRNTMASAASGNLTAKEARLAGIVQHGILCGVLADSFADILAA